MSKPRPIGLGPCDLLTVQEACRVLRIGDREGRDWLSSRGLIRRFCGRARVRMGDLYEAFDGNGVVEEKPTAPRGRLRLVDVCK